MRTFQYKDWRIKETWSAQYDCKVWYYARQGQWTGPFFTLQALTDTLDGME